VNDDNDGLHLKNLPSQAEERRASAAPRACGFS
jgi:hypothetical protein